MRNSKKKILFKMWKFPRPSETFIISQFITALKCNLNIQILVEDIEKDNLEVYETIIQEYSLSEKIINDNFYIPKTRITRILGAVWIAIKNLFHIKFLYEFFALSDYKLESLFQFDYYKKYRHYDIIHVQYGTNVKPLDILKYINFLKADLIVSFHGHDAFFPINGRIHDHDYYKYLFESKACIIANTPYLKEQLVKIGCPSNKIKIIPIGVDTSFFKSKTPGGDKKIFKIITVGRLSKVKGHEVALKAIKCLVDKGYLIKFTILGEGIERTKLEKSIRNYRLQKVVDMPGLFNQKSVRDLLAASDLYLSTSITVDNNRKETLGIANFEAQACGLPIVAFDSGGVKYTLKHKETGFIVPEGDVTTLTGKIEKLINDPVLQKAMGEAARNFIVANFAKEHIDKLWKEVYSKLS